MYQDENKVNNHVELTIKRLETHIKTKQNTFCCSFEGCKALFSSNAQKRRHEFKTHSDRVKCPIGECTVMVKPASLKQHIRNQHEQSSLDTICKLCGKIMKKTAMADHTYRCSNDGSDRPFKCFHEDCKLSFKFQVDLRKHMRIVHNSVRIRCPRPDCERYIKKANMLAHLMNVHDKVKAKCEKCGKEMLELSLPQHLIRCQFDGSKIYSCTIEDCGKVFKTLQDKNRHVVNVHIPRIKCPEKGCERVMKPANFPRHLKKMHAKNYSQTKAPSSILDDSIKPLKKRALRIIEED